MDFGQNLCTKRQIWVSETHFGEVWGDRRPWLMAICCGLGCMYNKPKQIEQVRV